jgi:hypothetical protein
MTRNTAARAPARQLLGSDTPYRHAAVPSATTPSIPAFGSAYSVAVRRPDCHPRLVSPRRLSRTLQSSAAMVQRSHRDPETLRSRILNTFEVRAGFSRHMLGSARSFNARSPVDEP